MLTGAVAIAVHAPALRIVHRAHDGVVGGAPGLAHSGTPGDESRPSAGGVHDRLADVEDARIRRRRRRDFRADAGGIAGRDRDARLLSTVQLLIRSGQGMARISDYGLSAV